MDNNNHEVSTAARASRMLIALEANKSDNNKDEAQENGNHLLNFSIVKIGPNADSLFQPVTKWMSNKTHMRSILGDFTFGDHHGDLMALAEFDGDELSLASDEIAAIGDDVSLKPHFSPKVQQLFGPALENLNVLQLSSLQDMCYAIKNRTAAPVSVIGLMFLVRNGRIMKVNNNNHHQLVKAGNKLNVNLRFFSDNINYRSKTAGFTSKFLEIGIGCPSFQWSDYDFLETQCFRSDCQGLAVSPFIEQGTGKHLPVIKSTLFNGFAEVAAQYHAMPLVGKALVSGFHPLFLFKHFVPQRDNFRGHVRLNTCSQGAISSIHLVGFMRGIGSDAQVISISSVDGDFITKAVINEH